jgi:hypothetical protein
MLNNKQRAWFEQFGNMSPLTQTHAAVLRSAKPFSTPQQAIGDTHK